MADPGSRARTRWLTYTAFFAAFTAVYYLSARIGLIFGGDGAEASPVWPAAGLALSALLILGLRCWPGVMISVFVANALPGEVTLSLWIDLPRSLIDAATTTGEAALACWLLGVCGAGGDFLGRADGVYRFTVVVLTTCALAATLPLGITVLTTSVGAEQLLLLWFIQWVGDCAGMLVITPLILTWWQSRQIEHSVARNVEALLALGIVAALTLVVFTSPPREVFLDSAPFLIFPAFLWGSYRLGRRQVVTMVAVSASIAIWGTFHGYGPFADESATASLLLLQLYIASHAVGFLSFAAAYGENRLARQSLAEQKEEIQVTLDSIGDGVITTDRDTRIIYLNPVAEQLSGWENQEARGRLLGDVLTLLQEEVREPVPNPVTRMFSGEPADTEEACSIMVSREGREFYVEGTTAPLHRGGSVADGAVLVLRDITRQRRLAREMSYYARHDTLTGLVNRREFERRLEHTLDGARRYGTNHAVCYLDLDQFKIVNDTAGHAAGDELLRQIRVALAVRLRERDTLARIGGDEFGLLLENCPIEKALEIAQSLIQSVRHYRFVWKGMTFQVGASAGISAITPHTESVAQVLTQADVACYTAKELGRNQAHVYSPLNGESGQRHQQIQRAPEMRNALENDRFKLFCQPIASIHGSDQEPYYEVLLRMVGRDGELIKPEQFILAAERFDLAKDIDRWVIRAALRQHVANFGPQSSTRISINLSGTSLTDETLLGYVLQELASSGAPATSICFEVTETAAIRNIHYASRFIDELRAVGCRMALDDFGSGLSSFAYLKNLSVDYLKIDGSFVRNIAENKVDLGMVTAINDVGRIMAIETIAEFTETAAVLSCLRDIGVNYAQGFYIGRPQPMESLGQGTHKAL